MKNILIPLIILAFLFTAILCNLFFLKKTTLELSEILDNVTGYLEKDEFKKSEAEMMRFLKKYEEYDGLYTMTLNHFELDEIKTGAKKSKEYIKSEEKGLVLGELSALKERIKHLYDVEKIDFYNVF